jgi:hypothetical protein
MREAGLNQKLSENMKLEKEKRQAAAREERQNEKETKRDGKR